MEHATRNALAPMDFTSEFLNSNGSTCHPSPLKSRLEMWSPNRPIIEDIENKIVNANARREEGLSAKKEKAARDNRNPKVEAKAVAFSAKVKESLDKRMAAAEEISEAVKQEKVQKGSKMADTTKGEAVLLSEKIGATMTKELNDKRHAEAEARAKAAKFEKAAKAAKMSDTSKSEAALQSFTAAQTKEDINKRLAEAEARAVATKKETVAKAAKMSTRKAENIKQQFEESIKAKKAADAKRHAEAEARAETALKTAANKAAKTSEKAAEVQTKRTLLFEMEEEKAAASGLRHAEALARKEAIIQEKAAKAIRMAGGSPSRKASGKDLEDQQPGGGCNLS
jgi:hypothetical protein